MLPCQDRASCLGCGQLSSRGWPAGHHLEGTAWRGQVWSILNLSTARYLQASRIVAPCRFASLSQVLQVCRCTWSSFVCGDLCLSIAASLTLRTLVAYKRLCRWLSCFASQIMVWVRIAFASVWYQSECIPLQDAHASSCSDLWGSHWMFWVALLLMATWFTNRCL